MTRFYGIDALRVLEVLRRGVLATTLAALALFGVAAWFTAKERASAVARKNADLVSEYVLRLVETHDVMLTAAENGLALLRPDNADDKAAHLFLRELADRLDANLGLAFVGDDGRFVVSSQDYPTDGAAGERAYLRMATPDRLFVDRIRIDPGEIDALVIARRASVPVAGRNGVWVAGAEIAAARAFLQRIAIDEGSVASVIREDGSLLVRSLLTERPVTLGPDEPAMRVIREGGGVYQVRAVTDGVTRIYATVQVGDQPLWASFGVSRAVILREWAISSALAAVLLGTIASAIWASAGYAARSLRAEAERTAHAFDRRLLAEAEKTAALRETMLRELNHRVKNNLQMIQALVHLQRNRPGGPDLEEITARVGAVATIHDLLYRSDCGFEVDMAELLGRIGKSEAVAPPEGGLEVVLQTEPLVLDVSLATPLALCIVELLTNAAKHAYGSKGGRVEVTLGRIPGGSQARLTIADAGEGMPTGGRRSGLRVVEELVRQIGGTLRLEATAGTRFEIDFPVRPPHDA